MNIRNIKYVSVFSIILLFTIYQFLLSFNVIPYFLSGQDIYALLFLLLSLVLLFISIRIEDVSAKVSTKESNALLTVSGEETESLPSLKQVRGLNLFKYIIYLQGHLKDSTRIRELLERLLVIAAKLTRSARASIMLHNKKSNELSIYKTMGWESSEIELLKDTRIKPGEGIAGRVFLDQKPMLMNQIKTIGDFESKDKYKTHSFVSFPIFSGKEVIGVINLTEKKDDRYLKYEVDLLTFLLNETSIHLNYMMRLEKSIID